MRENPVNLDHNTNKWTDRVTDNAKNKLSETLDNFKITGNVLDQINNFVTTHQPFTKGSEWVVYKVPVKIDNHVQYFLIAKKRYDDNTESEYQKHRHILRIMDKKDSLLENKDTKKLDEIKDEIKIPKLYGHWQAPDGENEIKYIVMDYVQGKTLFTLAAEELTWYEFTDDTDAIKTTKQYAYETEMLDLIQDGEVYNYLKKKITDNKIKIFDEKEWINKKQSIKIFLQHIHNNWFYHRDLGDNLRNIMIWEDGKIHIIDFGKSKIIEDQSKHSSTEDEDIYLEDNNIRGEFRVPKDTQILNFIDLLSVKKPIRQPGELSY